MSPALVTQMILIALTVLALVACGPSPNQINQIVDDRLAQALTALPTATAFPTATPTPTRALLLVTPTPTATTTPPPIPTLTPTPTAAPTPTPVPRVTLPDVASVVTRVGSAVLQIISTSSVSTSQGSGVIFSRMGHVLTNNHVVEDSINVKVALANRQTVDAVVIGSDPETDLAVLKIASKDIAGLAVATLGDTDAMLIGDWVIAIGSPLGFEGSVTVGVISAKQRSIDIGDTRLYDLIQTDAVINPGNSGGPLLNLNGEVIGINTAIIRGGMGENQDAEGIGFSISMGIAIPVSDQLIERGFVIRPKFGINIVDVTPANANSLGVSVEEGVLVTAIVADGPADRAGLKANDVVTHIDGVGIRTTSDLIRKVLSDYSVGDNAAVKVMRAGEIKEFLVELGP